MNMQDEKLLKLILETVEWQSFECKRAAVQPRKLLETVDAFANAEGGFLIVGLEDPEKAKNGKRLIGISENLNNISEFLNLLEKEIIPPIQQFSKFDLEIKNTRGEQDHLLINTL